MSDANPKLGNPAENLAWLIGQSIEDDVDAYDMELGGWTAADMHALGDGAVGRIQVLRVTRDGREFYVTVVEVEER